MTIRADQETILTLRVRIQPAAADVSPIATRLDVTFTESSTRSTELGPAPGWTPPLLHAPAKAVRFGCEEGLPGNASPFVEELLHALGTFLVQLRPELGEVPTVTAKPAAHFPAQTMPNPVDLASNFHLTRREREVMEHVLAGHLNKQTAYALMISPRTVEHYRAAAMLKIGTQSSADIRMTAHARRTEKAL